MKILVIIPCYNEQESIERVVANLKEHAPFADYLIVNDCSRDNTEKILRANGMNYINNPINLGIGGGVQATMHLKAITLVRDIKKVTIWCPTLAESERFCEKYKADYPQIEFVPCANCEDAVKDADIVNTVTPSSVPVLFGKWVKEGTHINAVGACGKANRELDTECMVIKKRN